MRSILVSLLAATAVGLAAAADLKIDYTYKVKCDRKTKSGDKIDVHYRGTLASNGEKFDASKSAAAIRGGRVSRPVPRRPGLGSSPIACRQPGADQGLAKFKAMTGMPRSVSSSVLAR